MKSSILGVISLTLLLATVGGCGKDSSSGSGGKYSNNINYPINGVPVSASQAYSNFKKWYSSNVNGNYPGPGLYDETRTTYTYNSGSNCNTQPIKIFGIDLGNIQACSYNSSPVSTTTSVRQVAVLFGGGKSSNSLLASIANGSAGKLISGSQSAGIMGMQSSLYVLRFQKPDATIKEYWIDTGVNSAFQPMKTVDVSQNKEEVVTKIK